MENASQEPVVTIHNDSFQIHELRPFLALFSAIIIGPGPGHPENEQDVGIIPSLFDGTLSDVSIPILGICLGFQSLCLSQGCKISVLQNIAHGQIYHVTHNEDPLFGGIKQKFKSVRYHSLYVPELNSSLTELAWTIEERTNKQILMAVKHKDEPWFGVQYHPESICSEEGQKLIQNFMKLSREFNKSKRQIIADESLMKTISSNILTTPFIEAESKKKAKTLFSEVFETQLSILEIADRLHQQDQEIIFLNSAANPGNWSIIGLPNEKSTYITHSTDNPKLIKIRQADVARLEISDSIWDFTAKFMSDKLVDDCDSEFPFIGGLMGIFSYEEGQFIRFDKLPQFTTEEIPDTKLVYVENCILQNNTTGEVHLTSIDSKESLDKVKELLSKDSIKYESLSDLIKINSVEKPNEHKYKELFHKCQDFLHSGNSYELCLTVPTKLRIPATTKPWDIYRTLTCRNPSPYSAYFNFDDSILISSSPERFLNWDNKQCELRPIKGTVRKTPEMTFELAKSILHTPKEIGENLMIVDLIRHDLYQLLKTVEIDRLMQVEEYSTVYQLVSAIRGIFETGSYTGIDVLSRSLPPGSMTGAPKKRSVEILQGLEDSRRGFYSGVCGYWSVENKADWSVIIRSLFHYKQDLENNEKENLWRIGAGGAITVLSDAEGEWQEMLTKLDSALQAFTFE